MKRRLISLLILLPVLVCLCLTAWAETPRLRDEVQLFRDPQQLESLLLAAGQDYDAVVAAAAVDSFQGQYVDYAAEDFYDSTYGPQTPGVLLFISMADREYCITVTDGVREAFNDKALAHLKGAVEPYLRNGDYDGAVKNYAAVAHEMLRMAAEGSPYGTKVSPLWILGSLGLGSLFSALPMGRLKSELKSVRRQERAANYAVPDSLRVLKSEERFLSRTTQRIPIQQQSSGGGARPGSSHTSVSGKF